MLDYGNLSFPFRKFPNGVVVDFYENDSTKNKVEADSAIIYNKTNLVELRNNVKITTTDSTILETDKLFWDRSIEWLYTENSYTLKLKNGTVNDGVGFDANQNFTNFNSRNNIGTQVIDEQ
jgi:LPS export ABC transporter protein LptC